MLFEAVTLQQVVFYFAPVSNFCVDVCDLQPFLQVFGGFLQHHLEGLKRLVRFTSDELYICQVIEAAYVVGLFAQNLFVDGLGSKVLFELV